MAEYSSFFNSFNGDRRYTAAQFVEYFASFIGNGVFWGGNALKVDVHLNMDVRVATGKAFINGYYYKNEDGPKVLTVFEAHPTQSRIDRVVLQLSLVQSERMISAVIKPGEPAAYPVPPALRRDNAVYELGLADIRVNPNTTALSQSNITDLRLDAGLCGVVAGLINQPDLTEIFNQYQAKFAEINQDWDEWYIGFRNEFEGWFAQVRAEFYAQGNTDFDDWSRLAGYQKETEFLEDGGIDENIINSLNDAPLATRTTRFSPDGAVVERLEFFEPQLVTTKTTTFTERGVLEKVT